MQVKILFALSLALAFSCTPTENADAGFRDVGSQNDASVVSDRSANLADVDVIAQADAGVSQDAAAADAQTLDVENASDVNAHADVQAPDASAADVDESVDAALADAGAPDASAPDASAPDASLPDAGETFICRDTFISGPGCANHDAELAAKARRHERAFHTIVAATYDLSTELAVNGNDKREALRSFVQDHDTWDYEATMGNPLFDDITVFSKTAGLFSGVGIAADAYRYAVLRDEGASDEEVSRARAFLIESLEALHLAKTIPGVPGVIARGVVRTDVPAIAIETVPLFDANGNAMPAEKTNGTWREDNSGQYPNYVWEDSCSRDQYIGWVAAYGAAWEVIENDASIDAIYKTRLQNETAELGLALIESQGFRRDLEIPDADGRTTFHGYLHHEAYERTYVPFLPVKNAVNAIMALGIVSTLAWVSQNAELQNFLNDELINRRDYANIAEKDMQVDFGNESNFSNYNMAFMGALLAARTLEDAGARAKIRAALNNKLYRNPGAVLQPDAPGWKHTLYDYIYATTMADHSLHRRGSLSIDNAALTRGTETLEDFDEAPLFDDPIINCDEAELEAESCIAVDGVTTIELRGSGDRFDKPMAQDPVPLSLRPRSSYEWRSHPFRVNHEGSALLFSGVDFRYAYWMGRYLER